MQRGIYSFVLLMSLMGIGAFNPSFTNESTFELEWEDNFDTKELNKNYWTKVEGDGCPKNCGWGNEELQFYTTNKENVRVENGNLILEAFKNKTGNKDFSSGKVQTKNKVDWKHGKIEIRAKLPRGRGTWPAFWMLPTISNREMKWPKDGEIDIMEHVGFNQGVVVGAVHTDKYNGMYGNHKADSILLVNAHEEFHTYSVEWTEEDITWLADGTVYMKLSRDEEDPGAWPFNQFNYHLIMNLAVGGRWGGRQGIDDKIWPQRLTIDYVKYYQLKKEYR